MNFETFGFSDSEGLEELSSDEKYKINCFCGAREIACACIILMLFEKMLLPTVNAMYLTCAVTVCTVTSSSLLFCKVFSSKMKIQTGTKHVQALSRNHLEWFHQTSKLFANIKKFSGSGFVETVCLEHLAVTETAVRERNYLESVLQLHMNMQIMLSAYNEAENVGNQRDQLKLILDIMCKGCSWKERRNFFVQFLHRKTELMPKVSLPRKTMHFGNVSQDNENKSTSKAIDINSNMKTLDNLSSGDVPQLPDGVNTQTRVKSVCTFTDSGGFSSTVLSKPCKGGPPERLRHEAHCSSDFLQEDFWPSVYVGSSSFQSSSQSTDFRETERYVSDSIACDISRQSTPKSTSSSVISSETDLYDRLQKCSLLKNSDAEFHLKPRVRLFSVEMSSSISPFTGDNDAHDTVRRGDSVSYDDKACSVTERMSQKTKNREVFKRSPQPLTIADEKIDQSGQDSYNSYLYECLKKITRPVIGSSGSKGIVCRTRITGSLLQRFSCWNQATEPATASELSHYHHTTMQVDDPPSQVAQCRNSSVSRREKKVNGISRSVSRTNDHYSPPILSLSSSEIAPPSVPPKGVPNLCYKANVFGQQSSSHRERDFQTLVNQTREYPSSPNCPSSSEGSPSAILRKEFPNSDYKTNAIVEEIGSHCERPQTLLKRIRDILRTSSDDLQTRIPGDSQNTCSNDDNAQQSLSTNSPVSTCVEENQVDEMINDMNHLRLEFPKEERSLNAVFVTSPNTVSNVFPVTAIEPSNIVCNTQTGEVVSGWSTKDFDPVNRSAETEHYHTLQPHEGRLYSRPPFPTETHQMFSHASGISFTANSDTSLIGPSTQSLNANSFENGHEAFSGSSAFQHSTIYPANPAPHQNNNSVVSRDGVIGRTAPETKCTLFTVGTNVSSATKKSTKPVVTSFGNPLSKTEKDPTVNHPVPCPNASENIPSSISDVSNLGRTVASPKPLLFTFGTETPCASKALTKPMDTSFKNQVLQTGSTQGTLLGNSVFPPEQFRFDSMTEENTFSFSGNGTSTGFVKQFDTADVSLNRAPSCNSSSISQEQQTSLKNVFSYPVKPDVMAHHGGSGKSGNHSNETFRPLAEMSKTDSDADSKDRAVLSVVQEDSGTKTTDYVNGSNDQPPPGFSSSANESIRSLSRQTSNRSSNHFVNDCCVEASMIVGNPPVESSSQLVKAAQQDLDSGHNGNHSSSLESGDSDNGDTDSCNDSSTDFKGQCNEDYILSTRERESNLSMVSQGDHTSHSEDLMISSKVEENEPPECTISSLEMNKEAVASAGALVDSVSHNRNYEDTEEGTTGYCRITDDQQSSTEYEQYGDETATSNRIAENADCGTEGERDEARLSKNCTSGSDVMKTKAFQSKETSGTGDSDQEGRRNAELSPTEAEECMCNKINSREHDANMTTTSEDRETENGDFVKYEKDDNVSYTSPEDSHLSTRFSANRDLEIEHCTDNGLIEDSENVMNCSEHREISTSDPLSVASHHDLDEESRNVSLSYSGGDNDANYVLEKSESSDAASEGNHPKDICNRQYNIAPLSGEKECYFPDSSEKSFSNEVLNTCMSYGQIVDHSLPNEIKKLNINSSQKCTEVQTIRSENASTQISTSSSQRDTEVRTTTRDDPETEIGKYSSRRDKEVQTTASDDASTQTTSFYYSSNTLEVGNTRSATDDLLITHYGEHVTDAMPDDTKVMNEVDNAWIHAESQTDGIATASVGSLTEAVNLEEIEKLPSHQKISNTSRDIDNDISGCLDKDVDKVLVDLILKSLMEKLCAEATTVSPVYEVLSAPDKKNVDCVQTDHSENVNVVKRIPLNTETEEYVFENEEGTESFCNIPEPRECEQLVCGIDVHCGKGKAFGPDLPKAASGYPNLCEIRNPSFAENVQVQEQEEDFNILVGPRSRSTSSSISPIEGNKISDTDETDQKSRNDFDVASNACENDTDIVTIPDDPPCSVEFRFGDQVFSCSPSRGFRNLKFKFRHEGQPPNHKSKLYFHADKKDSVSPFGCGKGCIVNETESGSESDSTSICSAFDSITVSEDGEFSSCSSSIAEK